MSDTKDVKGLVPFTLYDFFGYLFPGMVLIGGIVLYFNAIILESHMYENLKSMYADFTGLFTIVVALSGLVLVYVLGHFIATISHITIDRIIVGTILKYPYLTLLGIEEKGRPIAWPMHKLILFLMIAVWLLAIAALFFPRLEPALVWGIIAIMVTLFVRAVLVVIKGAFPEAIKGYEPKTAKWPYMWFIGWHSALLEGILINPVRQLLSIDRGFSAELATCIKERISKRFGVNCEEIETCNFWLPCLQIMKNPECSRMTNNWLQLYGLNRNLCMVFVILSAFSIINHYLLNYNVSPSEKLFMVITIIAAVVFGIRYIMLYYTYYSKNVFRFFYIEECGKGD